MWQTKSTATLFCMQIQIAVTAKKIYKNLTVIYKHIINTWIIGDIFDAKPTSKPSN